jgi:hypothetical protein
MFNFLFNILSLDFFFEIFQFVNNLIVKIFSISVLVIIFDLSTLLCLIIQGGSLDDLFRDVLPTNVNNASPYIIGTLNPSSLSPSTPTGNGCSPSSANSPTSVTTNLQLHHNFRCVLFSHHMEPLRGFLGRYLRHRLLAIETRSKVQDVQVFEKVDFLTYLAIE